MIHLPTFVSETDLNFMTLLKKILDEPQFGSIVPFIRPWTELHFLDLNTLLTLALSVPSLLLVEHVFAVI